MGDINLGTKLKILDENVADAITKVDEVSDVIADNGDYLKSKNLLNPTLKTTTLNGVTCTNNGDGTYTLNGTANSNIALWLNKGFNIKSGNYIQIGCKNPSNTFTVQTYRKDGTNLYGTPNVFDTYFSKRELIDGIYNTRIHISSGTILENEIVKPMLVDADLYPDVTYDDFEPYVKSNVELTSELTTLIETLKSKGVID